MSGISLYKKQEKLAVSYQPHSVTELIADRR